MSLRRVTTAPGEILAEDYLKPLNMAPSELAEHLEVREQLVHDLIEGLRPVSGDLALRLGKFFNQTPEFWMNLQVTHELTKAEYRHGPKIRSRIKTHPEFVDKAEPT